MDWMFLCPVICIIWLAEMLFSLNLKQVFASTVICYFFLPNNSRWSCHFFMIDTNLLTTMDCLLNHWSSCAIAHCWVWVAKWNGSSGLQKLEGLFLCEICTFLLDKDQVLLNFPTFLVWQRECLEGLLFVGFWIDVHWKLKISTPLLSFCRKMSPHVMMTLICVRRSPWGQKI